MENEKDYVDPSRFPNHIPQLFLTGKRTEGRGGEEIESGGRTGVGGRGEERGRMKRREDWGWEGMGRR